MLVILKFTQPCIQLDGIKICVKAFVPKIVGDGIVINPFKNVSDIRFIATSDLYTDGKSNILIGVGPHSELLDKQLFRHNSVPSFKRFSY